MRRQNSRLYFGVVMAVMFVLLTTYYAASAQSTMDSSPAYDLRTTSDAAQPMHLSYQGLSSNQVAVFAGGASSVHASAAPAEVVAPAPSADYSTASDIEAVEIADEEPEVTEAAETDETTETAEDAPRPIQKTDGTVLNLTLDDIKACLNLWYSDNDIREATLITMAEDQIAQSQTIWSAHVWLYLDRVGDPGFASNQSLHAVLSDTSQFPTYKASNLSKDPDPAIEWVVRDVFARKVLEDAGATPEEVGRTLPSDVQFFNTDGHSKYNRFYRYCWGGEYDPFSSPYNPYPN